MHPHVALPGQRLGPSGLEGMHNKTEKEKVQLKCEYSEYWCKKVITMKKHIWNKHARKILTWYQCVRKFISSSYLNVQIGDKKLLYEGGATNTIKRK